MNTRRLTAAALAAASSTVALLGMSSPASADVITKTTKVAHCDNPITNPQVCRNKISQDFHVNYPGSGHVIVKFKADPTHCSDIYATIYIDDYPEQTNRLRPGQSMKIDTHLRKGMHTVSVQAKGVYGGCNTGKLDSWSGRISIDKE